MSSCGAHKRKRPTYGSNVWTACTRGKSGLTNTVCPIGVNMDSTSAELTATFSRITDLHVGMARVALYWNSVETSEGVDNTAGGSMYAIVQTFVAACDSNSVKVMLCLAHYDAPTYLGLGAGSKAGLDASENRLRYAKWCKRMAAAFSTVNLFEFSNELDGFGNVSEANVRATWGLLTSGDDSIYSARPNATIIGASLENTDGISASRYLNWVSNAGSSAALYASNRNFGVAMHNYGNNARSPETIFNGLSHYLPTHNYRFDVPYYMTERGWNRDTLAGVSGALTSISNGTPAVFTKTAHGFIDGTRIVLTTTGTLPSPLETSATKAYWLTSTGADTFNASESLADQQAGTKVNTTTAGSGTHSVAMSPRMAAHYYSRAPFIARCLPLSATIFYRMYDNTYGLWFGPASSITDSGTALTNAMAILANTVDAAKYTLLGGAAVNICVLYQSDGTRKYGAWSNDQNALASRLVTHSVVNHGSVTANITITNILDNTTSAATIPVGRSALVIVHSTAMHVLSCDQPWSIDGVS